MLRLKKTVVVLLAVASLLALAALSLEKQVRATSIKCLFAETTPGQGTIQAQSDGSFYDDHVWDVYASTSSCQSDNIKVEIIEEPNNNINPLTTVAVPASYSLCYAGGTNDIVLRGYRKIGVDGNLICAFRDGLLDAKVFADEPGGLVVEASAMADVCVQAASINTSSCPGQSPCN